MKNPTLELTTEIIKTIVKERGLKEFSTALNNAFFHGEIIKEEFNHDEGTIQMALDEVYKGIEHFRDASVVTA